MKRAHRKLHLMIWLLLAPLILLVLTLAVLERPSEPVNEALPPQLTDEAR